MKRSTSVLFTLALAITLASNTFAGTIVGARANRTGTIVGARTGNIVGARTGNITGARTGNIAGTSVDSRLDRSKLGLVLVVSDNVVDILRLFLENPLF
jgi:outer membrane lipoprotein SlyB